MEVVLAIELGFGVAILAACAAMMFKAGKAFASVKDDIDANVAAIDAQMKRQQSAIAEIIIEQRRMTRVMTEQLELKKAEMTGDFEIVEEPILPTTPPPAVPTITLP